MKQQPYHTLIELWDEMESLRNIVSKRGEDCGIASLEEYFSLKKGYPLFIAGAPYSGKTEFALEILINSSKLYGWKHFIYVGEGGDSQDIYAELCHKYIEKPFEKSNTYHMDDVEYTRAQAFIQKHFVVANHDMEFTVADFYATVMLCEKEMKIKFDTTLFDPFNDIKDESDTFGGREDKYLASALKTVRIDAKRNKRINILVNHIADVRAVIDQKSNKRYMPPALPNEWAGGRTWWRRAFTMLLIYRPPTFMEDENGMPFEPNETHVYIQKSKPKGVGKNGMAKIFYDWKRNRYYSYDQNKNLFYSTETEQTRKENSELSTLANKEFLTEKTAHFQDDNPF